MPRDGGARARCACAEARGGGGAAATPRADGVRCARCAMDAHARAGMHGGQARDEVRRESWRARDHGDWMGASHTHVRGMEWMSKERERRVEFPTCTLGGEALTYWVRAPACLRSLSRVRTALRYVRRRRCGTMDVWCDHVVEVDCCVATCVWRHRTRCIGIPTPATQRYSV